MSDITRRSLLGTGLMLAGSALVSSAWARTNALLAELPGSGAAIAPREHLLFDFGWKFFQGHASDPERDLGFGAGQGDFAKTGDFSFATEKFDDSKWRSLNLPHDWAVELPFVHDEQLQGHGYKPLGRKYPDTSVGWYRRAFDIPASDLGRRVSLSFDGAFRSALIWVNGCFVGRNDNGYAPFRFDISDFLSYGAKNYVVIRMDASFGDGWFYEGAGIYRHVWLTKSDALHLGQWESYVRTEVKGNSATLSLGTIVVNQGLQTENARVRWQIVDAVGKTVATAESPLQSVGIEGTTTFTANAKLNDPALWSPENPNLYSAIVTVETNGKARDAERLSFGVRTVRFDVDKGFFLNGKSVKIMGACNHQDHAGVGAALPDRLQLFRLAVLKEMSSNAIRTSHNMPTPELVEGCDRMGMMMMCETRMMSSNPEGLDQLSAMVKRYRNHPSIIIWSIGNEEWILQANEQGERVAASMVAHAHALDPTRLCTAAINGSFGEGVSKSLDVEGFNYNLNQPDGYHKSHPTQPLIGTETASSLATRGSYQTDKLRNVEGAYDNNKPAWGEQAEEWWKFYAAREWLPGGFAWTGFDYRGEPTPYGWPSINSQFGIVDMCGFPKDTFYYYKAWWGKEPVLHLFPHWNWEQRIGEVIPVWVHSNVDEVELFLNGKSLGSQKVQPLTHLEWKVKYEPGVLEARGSKNGGISMTEKRETTGVAASLKLTADRMTINADGEDVAILRVETLDSAGRHVPVADNMIQFKVKGEGSLIGVGNGDPNSQESDKEPKRSLFNGLAQVIAQSTKAAGEISITAWTEEFPGPKLPPFTLTVKTSQIELRPQVK